MNKAKHKIIKNLKKNDKTQQMASTDTMKD